MQARQLAAFVPMKELLEATVQRRAEKTLLDFTAEAVHQRFYVDGVWHQGEPTEREKQDAVLESLKTVCGLNPAERRQRQQGKFKIEYNQQKFDVDVASQGVKTGERVILELAGGKAAQFDSFVELGMRESLQQQVVEALKSKTGMILFSAMPGGGFSTTWDIAMRSSDRLMRDFVGLEDATNVETHVENVDITTFDSAAGEQPETVLRSMILKQPDVYVVPDLSNGETVKVLCEQIRDEDKLVIAGIHAKDSVEALLRVLLLKPPVEDLPRRLNWLFRSD